MNSGRIAFHTLGCKLNFAETSTIARSFLDAGYARVQLEEGADVCVINTCSVTENADKKCRNIVRKALGHNPEAFIAVIGCYAQLKPEEIAAIPGVDLVLGAKEKFNLPAHLEAFNGKREHGKVLAGHIKDVKEFKPSYSMGDRTRTFLKVQDGCDHFCAFCTIPLARGRSRSAFIQDIVSSAKEIATKGTKEVVLTGVNIGDLGKNTGESFHDLVKALDNVEGIERFRISSIEPELLSEDIIETVASSKRFVPHFHIPLQSGCDRILKDMRRRYDIALYRSRIAKIKALMPNACIGVDVIVGYPGEDEAAFMETFDFLRELDVSYLHVFTYSERANTTAIRSTEVVPMHERHDRSKRLRILSEKKKQAFYTSQEGHAGTVLFEAERDGDYMYGFTENYLKVRAPYNPELTNTLVPVESLKLARDGYMEGELLLISNLQPQETY